MNIRYGEQYTGLMELINRSEDTTYVGQDDFRSGDVRIYSEGFGRCVGLLFLDYDLIRGAMAHISPSTDPYDLMKGRVGHAYGGVLRPVEKPTKIFSDPSRVRVIEVFDRNRCAWYPDEVRRELNKHGFEDFSYVTLRNRNRKVYHKTIALDVTRGLIHIATTVNPGITTVPFFKDNELPYGKG